MTWFFIGFILIMSSILVSRLFMNKAFLKLSDEKRLALIDIFAKTKIWNLLIPTFLFALFFLTLQFDWLNLTATSIIFAISLFTYIIIKITKNRRILVEHDFPKDYIKAYYQTEIAKVLILIIGVAIMNLDRFL